MADPFFYYSGGSSESGSDVGVGVGRPGDRLETRDGDDGERGEDGVEDRLAYGWKLYFGTSPNASPDSKSNVADTCRGASPPASPSDRRAQEEGVGGGNKGGGKEEEEAPPVDEKGEDAVASHSGGEEGQGKQPSPPRFDVNQLISQSHRRLALSHRGREMWRRAQLLIACEGLLEMEALTLAALELEAECPVQNLPPDLRAKIMMLLPISTLRLCSHSCKEWRDISLGDAVWRAKCAESGWGDAPPAPEGEGGGEEGAQERAQEGAVLGCGAWFVKYWELSRRKVFSWGCGTHGQTGTLDWRGDSLSSAEPVEIVSLRGIGVVGVSCGSAHSGCVTECGHIYTWGSGVYGRLGPLSFSLYVYLSFTVFFPCSLLLPPLSATL